MKAYWCGGWGLFSLHRGRFRLRGAVAGREGRRSSRSGLLWGAVARARLPQGSAGITACCVRVYFSGTMWAAGSGLAWKGGAALPHRGKGRCEGMGETLLACGKGASMGRAPGFGVMGRWR